MKAARAANAAASAATQETSHGSFLDVRIRPESTAFPASQARSASTPSRCRSTSAASGASPARPSCTCSSPRRFCAAISGCAMPSARPMASESNRGGSPSRLKWASTSRRAAPASATVARVFSRSTDFLSSRRSRSSAACTSSGAGAACASPVRSRSAAAVSRSRRRSRSSSFSLRVAFPFSSSCSISSPRKQSMSGGKRCSADSRSLRAPMASASLSACSRCSVRALAATAFSIFRSRSGSSASCRCKPAYSLSTRRRAFPASASLLAS